MFKLALPSLLIASALTSAACVVDDANTTGDLVRDDIDTSIDKADMAALELTPITGVHVDHDLRTRGGHVIVTSADSFEEAFGTPAPADIDFDKEWVAFFGLGTRNSGGYSASIPQIRHLSFWGGLLVESHEAAPGFDCITTKAITWPFALVRFEAPSPAATWFAVDHSSETYRCGPTNEDRQAELAESLDAWTAARDAANGSYTYTTEFQAFTGFGGRTTIVVDEGVVVERHYKAQHIDGGDAIQWSEIGVDEVGSHDEGARPRLIDDMYRECAEEILTVDENEHWMSFHVDAEDGLLRACTATPKQCFDGCDRGPKLSTITF